MEEKLKSIKEKAFNILEGNIKKGSPFLSIQILFPSNISSSFPPI